MRFVSVDPHPGDQDDPISLNEYVYCGNNPVNRIDPDGDVWFLAAAGYEGYILGAMAVGAFSAWWITSGAETVQRAATSIYPKARQIGSNVYQSAKKKIKKGYKKAKKTLQEHKDRLIREKWEPEKQRLQREIESLEKRQAQRERKLQKNKKPVKWWKRGG